MTVFEQILQGDLPAAKIYEDDFLLSFMDAFPQSFGHCLIIPKQKCKDLFEIDSEFLLKISCFSQKLARALKAALNPDGIKVAQFNGAAAGQTVFYYHLHLIPIYQNENIQLHGQKSANFEQLQQTAQTIYNQLTNFL